MGKMRCRPFAQRALSAALASVFRAGAAAVGSTPAIFHPTSSHRQGTPAHRYCFQEIFQGMKIFCQRLKKFCQRLKKLFQGREKNFQAWAFFLKISPFRFLPMCVLRCRMEGGGGLAIFRYSYVADGECFILNALWMNGFGSLALPDALLLLALLCRGGTVACGQTANPGQARVAACPGLGQVCGCEGVRPCAGGLRPP